MNPPRLSRGRRLRILDFDTECRPMHYNEFRPESQLTAIAWSWVGQKTVHSEVLQQNLSNEVEMLARFFEAFNRADIVTGHYLRKHDLPLLTDHCMRLGFPLPRGVRVSDTMMDSPRTKGLGKSQENLCEALGVTAPKHGMNGARWRVANQLDQKGRASARTRVVSDVVQNKELRALLVERGWLGGPKPWTPHA